MASLEERNVTIRPARMPMLADGYFAFCMVVMMVSVYLFPGYTNNLYHYLFWVGLLLALGKGQLKNVIAHPLVMLLVLFIAYTSISTIWAHDAGKYAFQSLKDGTYLLVALVVVVAAIKAFGIDRLQNWLMTASIAAAAIAILLTFLFEPDALRRVLAGGARLTHRSLIGMAENPIHSGFFIGVAAMFAVHRYRKAPRAGLMYAYLLMAAMFCAFVVLTKSRGALLFLIISTGLLLFFIRPVSRRRDFALLTVGALVGCIVISANADLILARFGGQNIRFEILRAYVDGIINSPFFGVGWSEDMDVVIPGGLTFSKPHNAFFHVLLVGGAVGFLMFVTFTVFPLYSNLKHGSDNAKVAALWLMFGSMYMAVDGRFPIGHASSQWLYYWIPIFMLIGSMIYPQRVRDGNV